MNTLRGLSRYLLRHTTWLLVSFLFFIGSNGAALLGPLVLGRAIDDLHAAHPRYPLLGYAALIVAVAVVQGVLEFVARFTNNRVSRTIEYELRNEMFAHFQRLELAYFQQRTIGDLVARAINDLSAVRMFLGPGLNNLCNTVIIFAATVAVMAGIDLRLTLYAGAALPLVTLVFVLLRTQTERRFKRVQDQFGVISARAQENFSGIRAIKAYTQEEAEIASFGAVNAEYRRRSLGFALISSLIWPAMATVAGISVVLLLWLGGNDVISHRITIGQFVQFNSYIGQLAWPMIGLGWAFSLFQQGAASWTRINEVLSYQPAIANAPDAASVTRLGGAVEFQQVSFDYGNGAVLHDIDLRIEPGQTVAIVGPTGAGKSTLVNLLPRVFQTERGRVLIDGVDVRDIPLAVLRRDVGYVPQESFLFSDTLAENVAYGVEHADQVGVEAAAEIAQLSKDVADFPDGYQTMVGERGVTLSGGQKQRAAIARAVMKDPAILILDDALSSVDTHTEEEILRRLRGFMAHRTSLIIAHRVSTVRHADVIVVLVDGRMVERGTHDALVARSGHYAAMYRRQLLAEELQEEDAALDDLLDAEWRAEPSGGQL
jgi:ATP-binding cassette subfamily B multidrug efflux pump